MFCFTKQKLSQLRSSCIETQQSLLLAGLELLVSVRAMDNELITLLVFNETSTHELLHHVCGQLPSLGVLLEQHDLLLQSMDFLVFGVLFQFLLQLSLLIGLNLLLGPSALAGGLQHVGRNAFGF